MIGGDVNAARGTQVSPWTVTPEHLYGRSYRLSSLFSIDPSPLDDGFTMDRAGLAKVAEVRCGVG